MLPSEDAEDAGFCTPLAWSSIYAWHILTDQGVDDMKKVFLAGVLIAAANFSAAYAGNVENGEKLFASPTLGGGTTGRSCVTCHADGYKLSADLFERKKDKAVAHIVNFCIEKPLGGEAIDPTGQEMADILAYMKSLVKEKKK